MKGTKSETREIFDNFLVEGLQLDLAKITLVDIHCLPQHLITKNGKRIIRPIIIKLANTLGKHYIKKNVKHLKTYHKSLSRTTLEPGTSFRAKSMTKSTVFIADHLPQKCYKQKMNLITKFKEPRIAGDRTRRGISNGSYCLFIINYKKIDL